MKNEVKLKDKRVLDEMVKFPKECRISIILKRVFNIALVK